MLNRLYRPIPILLFMLAASAIDSNAQQQTVFQKALANQTAAATGTVRNIGQTQHLITVFFPTASAAVSDIQIRIEASFDGSIWIPICTDITSAPRLGSLTYAMAIAYGPYPYIRVRSLHSTPSLAFDVWYTGHTKSSVSVIDQQADRILL
jgi:peptidoglycan/LPS O-acetylase OafA/YrhL